MRKVYIVDDDKDIVDSLTMILEHDGYKVASQYNEIDVVENIANFGPDLLLLDVMFPENDGAGFEIARLLKKDQRTDKLPILMLSAVNDKGDYPGTFTNRDIDEMWMPVNEFVEKPIRPNDLLEKTRAMMSA